MRQPLINAAESLRLRLTHFEQVPPEAPESAMPPYMETFLAHIRLLVGVPFENLVPDPRLLPSESVRFFYLDRSWADRLVDGAVAVGQIGSREQAHDHGSAPALSQQLDQSERMVRRLQRGTDYQVARSEVFAHQAPASVVTGLVIRSSAVSGWPHMDVRAYKTRILEPFETSAPQNLKQQLPSLRIERLAPAVLFALFQGVPELVILEEPHHGVQFGIRRDAGRLSVPLRDATGNQLLQNQRAITTAVPVRGANGSVVRIKALRDQLAAERAAHPTMVEQTGSAAFAVAVLDPPWRQRFEGTQDLAGSAPDAPLGLTIGVSQVVRQATLKLSVQQLLEEG